MNMVRRMVGPDKITATALEAEVGVPQPTLSRWLRNAVTVSSMVTDDTKNEAEEAPRRLAQDWTPDEKLRAVLDASGLRGAELGAFLRRQGLHEAELAEWRQAALSSLAKPKRRRGRTPEQKRIRQLESELNRKDKALAETAALLVMLKKADALWGDEGAGTSKKSGRRRSS
jgi:transposase-like protein